MIVALMTDSAGRTASVHYDYILKHLFLQLHGYIMIMGKPQMITRTVFKKTGRKSARNKHNTRFYISVTGNSLQDQSKDQQSIISNLKSWRPKHTQ